MLPKYSALSVLALTFFVAACNESPTASRIPSSLVSMSPTGGSIEVDPAELIEVSFSEPMMAGTERYVELHEGSYGGPTVGGTWRWASPTVIQVKSRFGPTQTIERTKLVFIPEQPLARGTRYTVHLCGKLQDARGRSIEYTTHGVRHLGGELATASVMTGAGMALGDSQMVPDWQHRNGTYGIGFVFTTAE
jgi:hypothetical protein